MEDDGNGRIRGFMALNGICSIIEGNRFFQCLRDPVEFVVIGGQILKYFTGIRSLMKNGNNDLFSSGFSHQVTL